MDKIWVAIMDSENYTWVACGETRQKALKAIQQKWNSDVGKSYSPLEKITLREMEEEYGVSVYELGIGECIQE